MWNNVLSLDKLNNETLLMSALYCILHVIPPLRVELRISSEMLQDVPLCKNPNSQLEYMKMQTRPITRLLISPVNEKLSEWPVQGLIEKQ